MTITCANLYMLKEKLKKKKEKKRKKGKKTQKMEEKKRKKERGKKKQDKQSKVEILRNLVPTCALHCFVKKSKHFHETDQLLQRKVLILKAVFYLLKHGVLIILHK